MEVVQGFFSAWPYWVPIVAFLLGRGSARADSLQDVKDRLERLAGGIRFPSEWETGDIQIPLDGQRLSREEQAKAAILVRSTTGHGSGIAISTKGLVLTNAHVVGDEAVVEIEGDGFSMLGRVVKRDKHRDVALIQSEKTVNPIGAVSMDHCKLGDPIYVVGAPYHTDNKQLLTSGVVSKITTFLSQPFIYTDAAIAPGNSGGPAFSESGAIIGITTAIQVHSGEKSHIGMLIPVLDALHALDVIDPHFEDTHRLKKSKTPTA